ncbi:MAG: hypothetical protein H6605_01845 [Flavobacteriales bacterium]|nr:hypothetical protein [Flavobacteriales bacterium]
MNVKCFLTCFVILLLFTPSIAQKLKEKQVPVLISKTFKDTYPKAKNPEWKLEKDGSFEVEFKNEEEELTVVYNPEGVFLFMEKEVDADKIDPAIREYILSVYKNCKIKEYSILTFPDGTENYEIEIIFNKKEIDLIFDDTHRLIKEKTED